MTGREVPGQSRPSSQSGCRLAQATRPPAGPSASPKPYQPSSEREVSLRTATTSLSGRCGQATPATLAAGDEFL